jgi:hypothetical protein
MAYTARVKSRAEFEIGYKEKNARSDEAFV